MSETVLANGFKIVTRNNPASILTMVEVKSPYDTLKFRDYVPQGDLNSLVESLSIRFS